MIAEQKQSEGWKAKSLLKMSSINDKASMTSLCKDAISCQSRFLILKLINVTFISCTAKGLRKHTKTVSTAESYLNNPCSPHQTDKQVYHMLHAGKAVLLLLKQ